MDYKSDKTLYVGKTDRVRVRFLGDQYELYQYFRKDAFGGGAGGGNFPIGDIASSSASPDNVPRTFFMEKDDGDEAFSRAKRIISFVVDRTDKKIKAFVCPVSAWNLITEHEKENDFEIWRTGEFLKTRYFIEPMGLSEVSDEQEQIVAATLESFSFTEIFVDKEDWEFVSVPIEPIENRWDILDFSSEDFF